MLKDLILIITFIIIMGFLTIIYNSYLDSKTQFTPQEEVIIDIKGGKYVQ